MVRRDRGLWSRFRLGALPLAPDAVAEKGRYVVNPIELSEVESRAIADRNLDAPLGTGTCMPGTSDEATGAELDRSRRLATSEVRDLGYQLLRSMGHDGRFASWI